MVVYVDDFKLAGPTESLAQGWTLIRQGLQMEEPTPLGVFLGCNHVRETITLADGTKAVLFKYEMENFMRSCVEKYLAHVPGLRLRAVETPFLPEDQNQSPQSAPCAHGPITECPWCYNTFEGAKHTFKDRQAHDTKVSERKKGVQAKIAQQKLDDEKDKGRLAPSAASIVMKILYGARFVRMDLLRMIGFLACAFTRWTSDCDKRLHRLVSYLDHTVTAVQCGWIADPLTSLQPTLYADADFAGCVLTQRSTTGVYLVIRGPRTCWPILGISKRQGCVSNSTPEAELVATSHALRMVGCPGLELWQNLLPHAPKIRFLEDNQAMLQCVKTGRNPTMRHLPRTHCVQVGWIHERYRSGQFIFAHESGERMPPDVFTKMFADKDKWITARQLINICLLYTSPSPRDS